MNKEFRYLVRLYGTNVDGTKPIPYALSEIKGIGIRLGNIVTNVLGFGMTRRLGDLSDSEIKDIQNVLDNPKENGIPKWVLNHRKDQHTGEDLMLIASDLELTVKNDIDLMKESKSWKGVRHSQGLKVRGQHTKTTARKGRSVGVSRSRIKREQR
jgi:small subunit ribosomal protein S13